MPSYAVPDINSNSWGVDQVTSTLERGTDEGEGDQTCGGLQVCVLGTHGARAEAERPWYASSTP